MISAKRLRFPALVGLLALMLACRLLVMAASGAPEQMRLNYTGSTSWNACLSGRNYTQKR